MKLSEVPMNWKSTFWSGGRRRDTLRGAGLAEGGGSPLPGGRGGGGIDRKGMGDLAIPPSERGGGGVWGPPKYKHFGACTWD